MNGNIYCILLEYIIRIYNYIHCLIERFKEIYKYVRIYIN